MAEVNKPVLNTINEIDVLDYSPKAIVLKGENTKPIKAELYDMGGAFNKWLKDNDGKRFGGWVFPKSQRKQVEEYLESIEFVEE